MSDMMQGIVGRRCSIMSEEGDYLTGSPDVTCDVLAADADWIKVEYVDPSGKRIVRMDRTETIERILVFPE